MIFSGLKKAAAAAGGLSVLVFLGFPTIQTAVPDEVRSIFSKGCATAGCHQGRFPAMNLVLEDQALDSALIGVPSRQLSEFLLIDTKNPSDSYLWLKLTGDKRIDGRKMPLEKPELSTDELSAIRDWILSLTAPESPTGVFPEESLNTSPSPPKFSRPAFWSSHVINIPTPTTANRGDWLLRISHRFIPSTKIGWDGLYGLDGPAVILFGLGYGLTDTLDLTFSRSKLYKEFDLAFKWRIITDQSSSPLPLTASIGAGGSFVTEPQAGKKALRTQNLRWNFHLSLAFQLTDALSILAAPAFSSNTDPRDSSSRGTFITALAARYMLFKELSILVEWIPVQTGYRTDIPGWGFGLEKKIGGHVFQIFALNSVGISPAQYLPGGDLRIKDGDIRLGFNIFRTF